MTNSYSASHDILAVLIWADLDDDMRVSQLLLAFVCSMEFWLGPLSMSPNLRGFARLVLEKNGQGEEETGGLMGVKGGGPVWGRAVEDRGRVSTQGS